MLVLTHSYLFATLGYNPILYYYYFLLKLFQSQPFVVLSGWLLSLFHMGWLTSPEFPTS